MAKYLIKRTDVFRVDTESEAKAFIEDEKRNSEYEVTKYSSELRTAKAKGEIVDEWYRVTIVKNCNSEKEPVTTWEGEE